MASAKPIVVLGAGSIGCFVGASWAAAGVPVRFIGRSRIANDLAANGLSASDGGGWQTRIAPRQLRFETQPDALAEAGLVLLTVKSGATAEAARQIAAFAPKGTMVISFQNGISNVALLRDTLGGDYDIVRGMVPFNVAYLGRGIFHKGVAGHLYAEDRPALRDLARQVADGPAALHLTDDMLEIAWGKLLINLNNAVNALSGKPLKAQLVQRDYRRVMAATLREGLAILDAARITPAKVGAVGPRLLPWVMASPNWLFRTAFMPKWKIDDRARSSMADDLAAGRVTEVDYLNGELVTLAEQHGLDAPINRRIVALIRKAEAGAPPLSAPDLRQAVLGG